MKVSLHCPEKTDFILVTSNHYRTAFLTSLKSCRERDGRRDLVTMCLGFSDLYQHIQGSEAISCWHGADETLIQLN